LSETWQRLVATGSVVDSVAAVDSQAAYAIDAAEGPVNLGLIDLPRFSQAEMEPPVRSGLIRSTPETLGISRRGHVRSPGSCH
jgi:hypothetical protein